jgi:cbb3-type cytochrome oxidase subunit 3
VVADLEALIPPVVMAILFIALVVTILRAQNPRRKAAAKAREEAAEKADPRISGH